jgi:ligand-binding SRPBCC domain-containing protein
MVELQDSIEIAAPIDRCFLLSTCIDLVGPVLGMKAVSGKTSGLVVEGDRLVWRGWVFGLPQMHETLITGYRRPEFFQDTMGRGRFAFFQHDHFFTEADGGTRLHDKVRFSLPFGFAGELAARYAMRPHIAGLVRRRFAMLQRIAEGEEWRRYLA